MRFCKQSYSTICLSFIISVLLSIPLHAQQSEVETYFSERDYNKVIKILTEKQATDELSFREYYLLSRSYGRTKQFGNGYILSSEMVKKANQQNDTLNLLKAFNLKAEHITDLYKIKEGVKFCDSITPFFRKKDSVEFMRLCFKCGMLYNYDSQPEKAYKAYKSITLEKYTKLSLYTNNIAIILLRLKKYDEALFFLKKSLQSHKKRANFDNPDLNVNYNNIAAVYLTKGNLYLAKTYLDSAYSSVRESSRLSSKKEIFNNYFKINYLSGNSKNAQRYLDSLMILNEALLDTRIKEKILSVEAANKKEKLLIKRVSYVDNELKITKEKILIGMLILLILILVFIVLVFLLKNRNIQSLYKNMLLHQRLSWAKLSPEYIDNSLNTIQKMITTKHPKSTLYISKFSKMLRTILENSRKPLVVIKDEINSLTYFLQVQQIAYETNFKFSINIDDELIDSEIQIPPMLIQPYIDAIIKNYHLKNTQEAIITIHFSYLDEVLQCLITDTATNKKDYLIIFSELKEKTKEILNLFSRKLNSPSRLVLESNSEETTKIIIKLPHQKEDS